MSLVIKDATLQSKYATQLNESSSPEAARALAEKIKANEPDVVIKESGGDIVVQRYIRG